MNRSISRVLAAAVVSSGFVVAPLPAFGDTLTCTSTTFNANTDGNGNITVTCTKPGSTPTIDPASPPPPPPPPPPTTTTGSCSGYTNTVAISLAWVPQSYAVSKGFGNNSILVASFKTPAISFASGTGTITTVEYQDGKVVRTAALSTQPCDLTGVGVGAKGVITGQQAPGLAFQIGGTAPTSLLAARYSPIILQPNTTYYLNIVNQYGSAATCTSSTCNMIVQLNKPSGT